MTPELTNAVRCGAVNLVEEIVFGLVHEAYLNGRKGIEEELKRMHENRDQWRSFAYEAKDKLEQLRAIVAAAEDTDV